VDANISVLVVTAFATGIIHTLLGPDHYVPFVALARCQKWSARKTIGVTCCCGAGHLLGSIIIGVFGLLLGSAVLEMESLEAVRGSMAAWMLNGFGIAYLTWGIFLAIRNEPHTHTYAYRLAGKPHDTRGLGEQDQVNNAQETSLNESRQVSKQLENARSMTPWIIFLIFAFGPCEVLIPLLMVPAAEANPMAMLLIVAAFAVATLGTMVAAVISIALGLKFVRLPNLHRFSHAFAGMAIVVCGALIQFGF
jgi:hypothetical protein